MKRRRLRLKNFSIGMSRDSALQEDRLFALRTLKNYFIDYTDGRLRVRNGYTRWNAVPLAAPPDQLFHFVDLSLQEELLAIVDNKWYSPQPTGAHLTIETEATTAPRPIFMDGNRCFFATDSGWYWTDYSSINGATPDYRAGIVRSDAVPLATPANGEGNIGSYVIPTDGQQSAAANLGLRLNSGGQQKLAMVYTPATEQTIQNIVIHMRPYPGDGVASEPLRGSFRAAVYTGAAEPTAIHSAGAVSNWIDITGYTADEQEWLDTNLQEEIVLAAATKYWVVLEIDRWYENKFADPTIAGAGNGFYVSFAYTNLAPAGDSLVYDGANWGNQARNYMATFNVGGLNVGNYYDYKLTFYNDTYKSESRPSPASLRVDPTLAQNRVLVSPPGTLDGQVDYIGVYRRDRGSDPTLTDAEIIGDFEWVGRMNLLNTFTDNKATIQLGAKLGSDDHYLYDETEDEGGSFRTSALMPAVAIVFKSRVWFAESGGRILYFSKIFDEDSAFGIVGDSSPDYFPLENELEIDESSDIIALKRLSADELAIYFRNTSIWTIRGTDDPRNPPADIVLRQMVTDVGLIAPGAVDSIRGSHVFLSRKGMYSFRGLTNIEYLSNGIQTILDGIGDTYLDDSVLITHGDSIWLAVDEDEDGKKENIYIFDIQRKLPTWRLYNYDVNINDMIVRETGSEYKTLLAADADNNYILELENGTTDNGAAIVAEVETQDLVVPNLATIHEVALDAYYPSSPPVYEGVITDSRSDTHEFSIAPRSIEDIPGHRAGVLVTSATGARVSIVQRAVEQNHLRGIVVGVVER